MLIYIKRFIATIIFVNLFTISFCQIGSYYKDATPQGLNVFLWEDCQNISYGILNSRIKELVNRGAKIDFIHPYERPKTTPFLNASGMLKRLDKQNNYTQGQIDSMEIEAVKIVKYLAEKGANIHAVSSNNKMNA